MDDMPTPRYQLGCGVVRNHETSELEIVVAGGAQRNIDNIEVAVDTVEIFSMADSKWRTAGKNTVPRRIIHNTTIIL